MEVITKYCDICGNELSSRWEDHSGHLDIKFHKNSCNKVCTLPNNRGDSGQRANIVYQDICCDCQRSVETLIMNLVKGLSYKL